MRVTNLDERIHVLDNESNVMTVIKDIAMSGLQEEAFYVLDIGDIVRKHQIWREKLPRVEPYYGKLLTAIDTLKFVYLFIFLIVTHAVHCVTVYVISSISAVKCNDNLIVIGVLAALGIGFDCASKVHIHIHI